MRARKSKVDGNTRLTILLEPGETLDSLEDILKALVQTGPMENGDPNATAVERLHNVVTATKAAEFLRDELNMWAYVAQVDTIHTDYVLHIIPGKLPERRGIDQPQEENEVLLQWDDKDDAKRKWLS